MAKIKLTRPELKRQRDALKRYSRYLPMLKLRQSQLQVTLQQTQRELDHAKAAHRKAKQRIDAYRPVFADRPGVNLHQLAEPTAVRTRQIDVAGIEVPELVHVDFDRPGYSLVATPVWIDGAMTHMRDERAERERVRILETQYAIIHQELRKTIQRVNLFEQVKIPDAKEAIRRIRISLGDEQTSAIGRAKIAKGKLQEAEAKAKARAEEDAA